MERLPESPSPRAQNGSGSKPPDYMTHEQAIDADDQYESFSRALGTFQRVELDAVDRDDEYVGVDILEELRVICASWVAKDIALSERVEWSPKVLAMFVARVLAKNASSAERMATALLRLLTAIPVSKTMLMAQLVEIAEDSRMLSSISKSVCSALHHAALSYMLAFYKGDDRRPILFVPFCAAMQGFVLEMVWDHFFFKSSHGRFCRGEHFLDKSPVDIPGLRLYMEVCALHNDLESHHDIVRLVAQLALDKMNREERIDETVLHDAITCADVFRAETVGAWLASKCTTQ